MKTLQGKLEVYFFSHTLLFIMRPCFWRFQIMNSEHTKYAGMDEELQGTVSIFLLPLPPILFSHFMQSQKTWRLFSRGSLCSWDLILPWSTKVSLLIHGLCCRPASSSYLPHFFLLSLMKYKNTHGICGGRGTLALFCLLKHDLTLLICTMVDPWD